MADALSRVPGAETLQLLQLCSGSSTLGIQHLDDTVELAGGPASLASVITIFENDSFVQALKREQQECKGSWFEGIKQLASRDGSDFVYRNGLVCKLVQDHFCPVLPDANSSTV